MRNKEQSIKMTDEIANVYAKAKAATRRALDDLDLSPALATAYEEPIRNAILNEFLPYADMVNKAMRKKLIEGECLDVRKEGEFIGNGRFRLRRFVDDMDYCDAQLEHWIWSVGTFKETGEIIASVTAELYQNEQYDCLFLR